MSCESSQLVADNYPRIAKDLISPMLRLLSLAREHCGGDVDKFLVILVVGMRSTRHREFARRAPEAPGAGTNGRSIAESLGIPKETVRRKVCELIESGWLVRQRGRIYLTGKAYHQLAPVREQVKRLAVENHAVVAGLLAPVRATPS